MLAFLFQLPAARMSGVRGRFPLPPRGVYLSIVTIGDASNETRPYIYYSLASPSHAFCFLVPEPRTSLGRSNT